MGRKTIARAKRQTGRKTIARAIRQTGRKSLVPALNRPASEIALNRPARQIALNRPARQIALNQPARQIALNRPASEIALNRPAGQIALYQPARQIALNQPAGEIAVMQPDRVVARRNIPQNEHVRTFAPIRIFMDENNIPQYLKVFREPNYRLAYSLPAAPRDIFDDYYRSNPQRHHVWSDHIVVRRDLEIDISATRGSYVNRQQLLNYSHDYLASPELFFYLNYLSNRMGHGLFTNCEIQPGSIIGEYAGELITMQEYRARLRRVTRNGTCNYFFETCITNMVIDAGPIGNHTRFINHDCENFNCAIVFALHNGIPRNYVISIRRIRANEQILMNYGRDYFTDTECLCGSDNCVTRIRDITDEVDEE